VETGVTQWSCEAGYDRRSVMVMFAGSEKAFDMPGGP
jgi:hypothetical protein